MIIESIFYTRCTQHSELSEIICTAHISEERNGEVGEAIRRKREANQSEEN